MTGAAHPGQPPGQTARAAASESGGRRLRTEARRLHRALFGHDAPEDVQGQYASALQTAPLAEYPRCDLGRLIERGIDLEALELALRRRTPANALTQRFHALCYLVEVRPEYYARFVNEPSRFASGVLTLALQAARSVYKLLKGRCLLWIYHVR